MTMTDENLRILDEARERLLREHGGFEGLCNFLLKQEQSRSRGQKPSRKAPAKTRRPKPRRARARKRASLE